MAPRDIFGIRSRARRRGRELAVASPERRPVDDTTESTESRFGDLPRNSVAG